MGGLLTEPECQTIFDVLGPDVVKGCDKMVAPEDPFQGRDETHHRNSWLWPQFARRRTKKADGSYNDSHVTHYYEKPRVDDKQCDEIYAALKEKIGPKEASQKLPQVCRMRLSEPSE